MRRFSLLFAAVLLIAAPVFSQSQTEEPTSTPAASVTIPITVDSGGNVSIPAGVPLNVALLALAGGGVAVAFRNGFSFWLEVRRARLKNQVDADAHRRALELDDSRTDNQIELSQSQQLKLLVEALAESNKQHEASTERNQNTLDAFVRSIDALSENSRSVVTLVTAMNARTDFLVAQGQRLEQGITAVERVLTNGETGTAQIVEEKMSTIDERLTALEQKVDAVQAQNAQILTLLQNILKLEVEKTIEVPAITPTAGADPAPGSRVIVEEARLVPPETTDPTTS